MRNFKHDENSLPDCTCPGNAKISESKIYLSGKNIGENLNGKVFLFVNGFLSNGFVYTGIAEAPEDLFRTPLGKAELVAGVGPGKAGVVYVFVFYETVYDMLYFSFGNLAFDQPLASLAGRDFSSGTLRHQTCLGLQ